MSTQNVITDKEKCEHKKATESHMQLFINCKLLLLLSKCD